VSPIIVISSSSTIITNRGHTCVSPVSDNNNNNMGHAVDRR